MTDHSVRSVSSEHPASQTSRFYLDVIRAYATIMIVLLHVAVSYIYQSEISPTNWWISNGYHAWSRTAVPLFILISGALLLKPRHPESIRHFLRKRALRILPPLVIWSGIYLIYEGIRGQISVGIGGAIASLLQQPAYGHLWFLYMILGLYLMTPILRVYIAAASPVNLTYALVLCLIFGEIFPLLKAGLDYHFYLSNFISLSAALGLFVGGYWLEQYPVTTRVRQRSLLLYGVGFGLLVTMTALVKNLNGGEVQGFIYEMDSPLALMMAMGSFLLFKSLPYDSLCQRLRWFKPVVKALSSTSFTIYLLHMMVVNALQNGSLPVHFNPAVSNSLWTIPVQTFIVLVFCYCFTVGVRKLPFGEWLAP